MENINKMKLTFSAKSENEGFARSVVACFILKLNPTLSQLSDIKTAVSEAVTNAIVHGYNNKGGQVTIDAEIIDKKVHISVFDDGVGIENIEQALEPFYTTKKDEERSGMGFTIMKSFMDEVIVESKIGCGTKVYMTKLLRADA